MSDTDRVAPRAVERFTVWLNRPGILNRAREEVEVVLASDYDALEDEWAQRMENAEATFRHGQEMRERVEAELQKQRELNMNAAISLVPGAGEYERKLTALKAENERLKAERDDAVQVMGTYAGIVARVKNGVEERLTMSKEVLPNPGPFPYVMPIQDVLELLQSRVLLSARNRVLRDAVRRESHPEPDRTGGRMTEV